MVTKDVPDYSILGGNPAMIIRYRFDPETIDMLLSLAWWDLPDSVINIIIPDLQSCASREDIQRIHRTVKSLEHGRQGMS